MEQSAVRPQKYLENHSTMYIVHVCVCVCGSSLTLAGQTRKLQDESEMYIGQISKE